MRVEGWFDAAVVTPRWHDHLSGRRDSTAALWAVLMFQAWFREQNRTTVASDHQPQRNINECNKNLLHSGGMKL
jgi:hypothetical protein